MEVEVEYNYEAEQSDELSIKVGDIIKNVTISEGGWWEGELNGKKGMFPDNFVKVIKDKDAKKDEGKKKDVQASKRQSVKDLANKLKGQVHEGAPPMMRRKAEPPAKKKKAKVVYSYEPENDDELKLEVGDVLDVIKQEEEGWWEGILNGKQGMFPSNFVEIVDEAGESPSPENADKFENTEEHVIKGKKIQGVGLGNIFGDGPIKLRSTAGKKPGDKPLEPPKAVENDSVYQLGGPIYNQAEKREDPVQRRLKETKAMEKAIVRYSYAAENEDELTLTEGETVNILDKDLEDSGWWKGELNGRIGVFPDNFVEIIKEELNKGPQPPIPAPTPKPKKPPPPTQASVTKPPPKLPDKAPAVTEHSKPDPVKEDKPVSQQPTIPTKKPVHPPPPLTKKPIKAIDAISKEDKKDESKTDKAHSFEAVETGSDKLTHLTASRPRGPAKRPPSQVFLLNPKTANVAYEEEERNGDVKEDKPHAASHHTTSHHTSHHHSKPDKSEEVSGKSHSVPSRPVERPQEPSPATASLQLAIDELRKDMIDLKNNSVSKTVFNELKSENERLKQELDSVKSTYSRRMRDIMAEVDEEKKIRLSTQVEIERIRKLVAESHV
ncbi:SH3 domain-containing kinase-binding protein 1-like isoform X6 [Ruditapes philippinarum]|uniref:SH3 domain-containing kinase-binding protein 1-like isoform X6 n=1 Tax=Ruditapes philippinarum TaxID=129788 RepID=UPI00295BCBD1|nr:SH3 domain-containing kinase-binding protein 1-like isoform X6 [Ruditapes philippinarum]